MTIAFAPAAVAAAKPVEPPQPPTPPARAEMPAFSPWRGKYLDLRPACWSLRNRPEEWNYASTNHGAMTHLPSNHYFGVGFGPFGWGSLYRTECSCAMRNVQKLSLWQRLQFRAAYKHWRKNHYLPEHRAHQARDIENINAHFRTHFS